MKRLQFCLALAFLLLPAIAARSESNHLLPYTPTAGYTYLTLGRYPQTAEGEVQPILWRVL